MTETPPRTESAPDKAHQFRLGLLKTLPIVAGIVPFGLAYGVLAVQSGLTLAETMLMSLVVFAGASQFMALGMFQAGVGGPMIVVSTLLINLRHLVMGLSLSPYLTEATPAWQRFLAFGMTDESYLVTITHYRDQGQDQGSPHFMLGSSLVIYTAWCATSLLGALAGSAIPDPLKWGLDFAMPATFLVMLLPQIVSRRVAVVVAISAVVATAAYVLIPGKWYIVIAVLVATSVGVVLETMAERADAR